MNTLTLSGTSQDLKQFKQENCAPNKPESLSFAAKMPMPDGADWYSWNTLNWGTKWDIGVDYVSITDDTDKEGEIPTIVYSFDTAWDTPLPWLVNISNFYPGIEFLLDYEEPGNDFAGTNKVCNGSTINDETWSPSEKAESQANTIFLEMLKKPELELDPNNFYDYYSNKLLEEKMDSKFDEKFTEQIDEIIREEMDYDFYAEGAIERFADWWMDYVQEWYEKKSVRKLKPELKEALISAAKEMACRPLGSEYQTVAQEFDKLKTLKA